MRHRMQRAQHPARWQASGRRKSSGHITVPPNNDTGKLTLPARQQRLLKSNRQYELKE